MNRRQFLTGTSAIAVSAALPVQPVARIVEQYIDSDFGSVVLQQVYYAGRYFWIGGGDQVVHFSKLCDPASFASSDIETT